LTTTIDSVDKSLSLQQRGNVVTIESAYGAYQEQLDTITELEAEGCDLEVWRREIEALEQIERRLIDGAPRTHLERQMQVEAATRRLERTHEELEAIMQSPVPEDYETVTPGVRVGSIWYGDAPYRRPIEHQPEPSPVTITAAPEPRAATPIKRPSLLRRVVARMTALLGSHKPA
jgi:hypothetical protein